MQKRTIIMNTLRDVFKKPRYIAIAITGAALLQAGIIWISNHQLLRYVFTSDTFAWNVKFKILWSSLGSFNTNFTLTSQITTTLVALLAGINIAMLIFYLKKSIAVRSAAGASGFGVIIGVLGVGCSACGSVIISSIIGVGASATLVNALPLHGVEFGLVSIALICLSIYWLAKNIQTPATCAIKKIP